MVSDLLAAFQRDPQTAGKVNDLHYEPPPEYTSHLFFYASWIPAGTSVIVKLDVDPWERYWMSAIDRRVPGLVSKVFAGGEHIGPFPLR